MFISGRILQTDSAKHPKKFQSPHDIIINDKSIFGDSSLSFTSLRTWELARNNRCSTSIGGFLTRYHLDWFLWRYYHSQESGWYQVRKKFHPTTILQWNPMISTEYNANCKGILQAVSFNHLFTHFTKYNCLINCLINSAGRHTCAPATVYSVCGDLIAVLDRNRNLYLQSSAVWNNTLPSSKPTVT